MADKINPDTFDEFDSETFRKISGQTTSLPGGEVLWVANRIAPEACSFDGVWVPSGTSLFELLIHTFPGPKPQALVVLKDGYTGRVLAHGESVGDVRKVVKMIHLILNDPLRFVPKKSKIREAVNGN